MKRLNLLAMVLAGLTLSASAYAQYTPNDGFCSGGVTGPHGDPSTDPYGNENVDGEFPAFLHSEGPYPYTATCQWKQFTTTQTTSTYDMTLTINVSDGIVVGSGRTYIIAYGHRWDNVVAGVYTVTIPAGTNLYSLTVNAYARSGTQHVCGGDGTQCFVEEANLQIDSITLQ